MKITALNRLTKFAAQTGADKWEVNLPRRGGWPESKYLMDAPMVGALRAAIGSGRPLLVLGEPGAGKSHLARAAAEITGRQFISFVVQPNTEYEELLWSIDHTERLGQAHRLGIPGKKTLSTARDPLAIEHYICPGPLWYAFDYFGDKPSGRSGFRPRVASSELLANNGVVLLIDEIDKADASMCNGLLEALGNGGFDVPISNRSVECPPEDMPLIVMTSNLSRQLPAAFLRRCVVYSIDIPEAEEFECHLVKLGMTQYRNVLTKDTLEEAARQTREDRDSVDPQSNSRAGIAEYLDLLRAIVDHRPANPTEQLALLADLRVYFHKQDY